MVDRLNDGRRFFQSAGSALLLSCLVFRSTAVSAQPVEVSETHCVAAQQVVPAFHSELNAGSAKSMTRLASTAEAAARALRSCADVGSSLAVIDRDRLRVRAADALLIASVARYRNADHRREANDLKQVLQLVSELDPAAFSSNEHLYQESRLLKRLAERILGKPQS